MSGVHLYLPLSTPICSWGTNPLNMSKHALDSVKYMCQIAFDYSKSFKSQGMR